MAKLEALINSSEGLNSIFSSQDPEFVAYTINHELSSIVNFLAPATVRQVRKDWCPFIGRELRARMTTNNRLLTKAITKNQASDWRDFRLERAKINDDIIAAENEYNAKNLNDTRLRWSSYRRLNSSASNFTPKVLSAHGQTHRKPAKLADICNNHYIEKIEKLRKSLANEKHDPMDMLRLLIPRNEETLEIPMASITQVRHLIMSMKSSGSTGYDDL